MTNLTKKELAHEKLNSLVEKYKDLNDSIYSANEATTRILIIDEILKILGWDASEFNPESHTSSNGYTDYLLKYEGVSRLVVEAKKIGLTFTKPVKGLMQHEYTVSYFKQAFKKELTETIKQTASYCYDNAVVHGVLTNGAEWLVLQMVPKPGKNIDSMKGVYFGNIFNGSFYFDLFYDLLSKEQVVMGNLDSYLGEINYSPSPYTKSLKSEFGALKWKVYGKERYLDDFYRTFFDEITSSNQKKMLEYCFVSDSKLEQYRGDLKRILKDNSPIFLPVGTDDLEPGESAESLIEERGTGKVVLITGSVGCGKTTLVRKVINETKKNHKENTVSIIVDLINDVSKNTGNAKGLIYKRIYEKFVDEFPDILGLESLRDIFRTELKVLRNGAYKNLFDTKHDEYIHKEAEELERLKFDIENFIIRAMKNKTSKKISMVLIIDNVDRASEGFQEDTYTVAHKISKESGATVIVTMREFTYFKNRNSGWLDVRSSDRVIHLKAPDFSKLIAKRIKYVESHFDSDFRVKEWRRMYDFSEFKEACQKYASVLKLSLKNGSNGQRILETLSCISWHNIRYFHDLLRMTHKQLGSSNLGWKYDEVIASLMISSDDGRACVLPNIFIPSQNASQSYFLKLRIMTFLNSSIKPNERAHGVPFSRILNFSKMYGYRGAWVSLAVQECIVQRLIECVEMPIDCDDLMINKVEEGTFRISPLGVILLQEIISEKIYISLLSPDLPIYEVEEYDKIKSEYKDVLSYMSDDSKYELIQDGVDLIAESKLPEVLIKYLSKQYVSESIPVSGANSKSELRLTEDKVKVFVDLAHEPVIKAKAVKFTELTGQYTLDLFDNEDLRKNEDVQPLIEKQYEYDVNFELINELIPKSINSLKINNSEFIPLILVALVIRKFLGFEVSTGVEITDAINSYLVDEGNKKESTNVSRSLRSNKFKFLPWLLIRDDLHHKFKKFSLKEGWECFWEEYFSERPSF